MHGHRSNDACEGNHGSSHAFSKQGTGCAPEPPVLCVNLFEHALQVGHVVVGKPADGRARQVAPVLDGVAHALNRQPRHFPQSLFSMLLLIQKIRQSLSRCLVRVAPKVQQITKERLMCASESVASYTSLSVDPSSSYWCARVSSCTEEHAWQI